MSYNVGDKVYFTNPEGLVEIGIPEELDGVLVEIEHVKLSHYVVKVISSKSGIHEGVSLVCTGDVLKSVAMVGAEGEGFKEGDRVILKNLFIDPDYPDCGDVYLSTNENKVGNVGTIVEDVYSGAGGMLKVSWDGKACNYYREGNLVKVPLDLPFASDIKPATMTSTIVVGLGKGYMPCALKKGDTVLAKKYNKDLALVKPQYTSGAGYWLPLSLLDFNCETKMPVEPVETPKRHEIDVMTGYKELPTVKLTQAKVAYVVDDEILITETHQTVSGGAFANAIRWIARASGLGYEELRIVHTQSAATCIKRDCKRIVELLDDLGSDLRVRLYVHKQDTKVIDTYTEVEL